MLDAAHREAEAGVHRAHPFGVTRGKVVVHRHHVHTAAGEGVQVNRQRGHQRFAFARGHFRNVAPVQRITTDELNVKVHHVPENVLSAHGDGFPAQTPRHLLHRRKGFRLDLLQSIRQLVIILNQLQLLLPRFRLGSQLVIRKPFHLF